jgi:hypothetical protein
MNSSARRLGVGRVYNRWDLALGRAIGNHPVDDAERWAAEIEAIPVTEDDDRETAVTSAAHSPAASDWHDEGVPPSITVGWYEPALMGATNR